MRCSTSCCAIRMPRTASGILPSPPFLFGLTVFFAIALLLVRGALLEQGSPVLLAPRAAGVRVLLGDGFPQPGVHQFSDGSTVLSVIKLAGGASQFGVVVEGAGMDQVLVDGMAFALVNHTEVPIEIRQGWMPARQRLALGIPLHPDRMSREDWVALPGIGERMALRIEEDRQKYGDFFRFEALERVKGIGPAKLKALRPFFVSVDK